MNTFLQRAVMAYRPMYLNGLLLDGQFKLPKADSTDEPASHAGSPRSRQRTLLAALIPTSFHRSKT
ncbi:hypothetical protein ACPPVV_00125 [Rhodanobacter sp. Col0626]|uniref:hypothetical protein n=1 Tax=Rhodanobacter sp. Col0626 TaxID=3415679 RepID=UPI003CEEE77A